MEITIVADPELISVQDLKTHLENQSALDREHITFAIPQKFAGIDPAVVVALLGATGTVVSALVTALLALEQQSRSGRVVIQTERGQRIEIPVDTPIEKLEEIIAQLKELDSQDLRMDLMK